MSPRFADALTHDVYHRILTRAAFRRVSGFAMYPAMRRIDVLLSAASFDDLRWFRRFDLQPCARGGNAWSIMLHGALRLQFVWDDGPRDLQIV